MWSDFKIPVKLLILASATSVDVSLLASDNRLMKFLNSGKSKKYCLDFINENY